MRMLLLTRHVMPVDAKATHSKLKRHYELNKYR